MKPELVIHAIRINRDYGDGSFLKSGKFKVGDPVWLKLNTSNFSKRAFYLFKPGVVVSQYVKIKSRRRTYYRVLFSNRKILSLASYELVKEIEKWI